ncbi:vitamin K epoxide reductase family protein [Planctomyces sp. SH-PL14]|uniref:vitamin K epoxide reductase family protein n=1 Tax=Planctomyces sp. SH-PL14 TaxID=1632864 RepID=UPI00078B1794|nr:vitamin K epoxide reductase family protein [Planctomyces sp. SH-PL14]AMV21620.1 Vitamin K epoxide reductase family protein [Planctomyces sp. SH-PL14]
MSLSLDINAPPWKYNPSSWSQRLPICALAAVAGLIATYMALYQWRVIGSVWDPVFGEQTAKVLDSDVSEKMRHWMLVPDAALGAVGYFSEALLGLAGSTRRWQFRPWLVILFGIDVIPLGIVSVILVVLQGTVVGFWCFPCLVTAAISVLLVYWAYDEVWSSLRFLKQVWDRTHDRTVLWRTFWGGAPPEAVALAKELG